MWRAATLRERKPLSALVKTIVGRRYQHNVALQLDYYMSPQFAGVACAVVNNTYGKNGLNLSFLPTCPVGLEQARVRQNQNENPAGTTLGSVEQNIFIPTLVADPSLKTTAVAAMFRRSPLCIASLRDLKKGDTIGAHEDTVSLLQRIFPDQHVIASPRATKNSDLMSDKLGGIQAYTTTEVPALRRHMGKEPHVTYLEGLNGTKLGYGQVLFAADECLEGDDREVVSAFLEATFQGWEMAIRDPKAAVEMVAEAKKMLGLDDEKNDHWYPSSEFEMEMVQLCNDHVKETFQGDRHGIINPARWSEASQWLMDDRKVGEHFGLDATMWSPSKQLLPGNELARSMLEDAKASAHAFVETHGRKPSLAVVTVGELARYTHADRRIQLYSTASNSWFAKTNAGEANGFDVQEINLDASTTTDELLSQIYALKDVDGIQLMWPLPDHIDTAAVFNAIPASKDADGIHYVGQLEIGNKKAYPPVTPLGVLALMKEHGVDVKYKRVLVIGRSLITGSPISHMLRAEGAVVTVAHSGVSTAQLETLIRESEVVITCAGSPGLIKAEWLDGTEVVNVGTTFLEATDSLHSDVEGPIGDYATRYSPVPGGVGPLSAPALFQNVARAAWDQMNGGGEVENSWERNPASLTKKFHFDSYTPALDFAKKVNDMSTIMDHHANIKFVHQCVDGVDVEMEFFTFEANTLTEKDYDAAKAVDMIYGGNQIRMKDYTYNLSEDSIAKYPASPRGSSKLLKVNGNGQVSHHEDFSQVFGSLAKGAHVVFNESRVLDARLFAVAPNGDRVEVMILDLGDIALHSSCNDITLRVMIRSDSVKEGDILVDAADGASKFEVVGVQGIWEEDGKSDGNGMECFVRIHSDLSLEDYLQMAGSVPIPPYFHRQAEPSDKEAYNNVYASQGGSVAAPTAGLHFTPELLAEIGADNCSYLSLHVGAGTFKPILAADARDHSMHAETFSVKVGEIRRIIAAMEAGKPLVVVGTTSSRTLESLFWCGVKRIRGLDVDVDSSNLELGQFEWVPLAVGESKNVSAVNAFKALIDGMEDTDVLSGRTSLMITPGSYDFKVVNHLITNFHAPDSTLMLLVSAFLKSGNKVKRIYEDAQKKGFRFLSYGDVCMFSRPGSK